MATGEELAEVMIRVVQHLNEAVPLDEVLQRIVAAAVDTIPGAQHAGISVWHRNGRIETLASTDDLVLELDRLQYSLREGPCVDAMHGEKECWVEDLSLETRWPHYGPQAVSLGVISHLGLQMFTEDNMIGGLNLYADTAHAFHADTPAIANLFTTHAAHAMGKAMKEKQLHESIASRTVIGQAMGIVMERYTLDQHSAFSFLKRTSQDSNTKLVDVASHLVNEATQAAQRTKLTKNSSERFVAGPARL